MNAGKAANSLLESKKVGHPTIPDSLLDTRKPSLVEGLGPCFPEEKEKELKEWNTTSCIAGLIDDNLMI